MSSDKNLLGRLKETPHVRMLSVIAIARAATKDLPNHELAAFAEYCRLYPKGLTIIV